VIELKKETKGEFIMEWKNVSLADDEKYEQFPIRFHVSDQPLVLTENGAIHRNITKELGLKFISCHYYADSVGWNMHPSMHKLIDLIEKDYEKVNANLEVSGFFFAMEVELSNGNLIYVVSSANNGQELVSGVYLTNEELLDDEEARNTIKELDHIFLTKVEKAGVFRRDR
jgi:hypothetical protein